MLAGKSLFPIDVSIEKPQSAGAFQFGNRVNGQLMAMTYGQMAALTRAGVPLLRSIAILRDQTANNALKEVLNDVHRQVEDGSSMADAMGKHPRVFSEMATNMVRAGGEGGFLEDAFSRVAKFTEQHEDLKSRTMGALAYPVILMSAGTIIVTVLIVFFVPMFGELFDQLREEGKLPFLTTALLAFSDWLRSLWGIGLALLMGVVAALVWARLSTEAGRLVWDTIKLRMPLLGNIFLNLAVARFCRVLGTLLHNGVPILRSLEISREATGNRVLSQAIQDASENVTAGESLAGPLSQSGHFPATVVEMISVAEESNTLETVLVEISDDLEIRTFRRLDLAVRLVEPLMLMILAGVVLCVVIALLLPVIKMSELA